MPLPQKCKKRRKYYSNPSKHAKLFGYHSWIGEYSRVSQEYLKRYRFPHLAHLHALVALFPLVRRMRRLERALLPRPHYQSHRLENSAITEHFDRAAEQYREHHFAYAENILDEELYRAILKEWPKTRYFDPPREIIKSYNVGFRWMREMKGDPAYLDLHPAISHLFHYFCGEEFAQRMTKFVGGAEKFSCHSFLITQTYPGSFVIPHMDSPLPKEALPYINMIFFVDGTGGERSGGLLLSKDNELKEIIFEPKSLQNSALIYDTTQTFYHGFDPVKWGKFRWAIAANFCNEEYRGK